jgi:hypothetical protein
MDAKDYASPSQKYLAVNLKLAGVRIYQTWDQVPTRKKNRLLTGLIQYKHFILIWKTKQSVVKITDLITACQMVKNDLYTIAFVGSPCCRLTDFVYDYVWHNVTRYFILHSDFDFNLLRFSDQNRGLTAGVTFQQGVLPRYLVQTLVFKRSKDLVSILCYL